MVMNIFYEKPFLDYKRHRLSSFNQEIESQAEHYILNADEDEYVNYLANTYSIDPLVLSFENISATPSFKLIDAGLFPRSHHVREGNQYKVRIFIYHIPYSGNAELLYYKPHKTSIGWTTEVSIQNDEISFNVIDFSGNTDTINQQAREIVQSIKTQYEYLNLEIDEFNKELFVIARRSLKGRKERIIQHNEYLKGIEVPIRKSHDTPKTFAVPEIRKKIKPVVPKPEILEKGYEPEPTLSDSIYQDILKLIHDVGKEFERLPGTYSGKDEETLRDHFLLMLEPNFEGSATGETFNKTGKTDILIRHEGNNIFVAECKFWKGEKAYLATIDQLLGYLTWRDSKTAIILFVTNKDFSSIVNKVLEVTPSHDNCVEIVNQKDDTWINSTFHLPDDSSRKIRLAVMLYHIPPR